MKKVLKSSISFGLAFATIFTTGSYVSSYDIKACDEPTQDPCQGNDGDCDWDIFDWLDWDCGGHHNHDCTKTTTYSIYYVDENGIELLPSESYEDSVGNTVTAYAQPIEGYTVDAESKSITLEKCGSNSITFVYTQNAVTTSSYTVKYVDQDTDEEIADEVTVNDVEVETVIQVSDYKKHISGYRYTKDSGDLTIAEDASANVMTIYYTKNVATSSYTVKFIDQDTNEEIADEVVVSDVEVKTVIQASDYKKDITGYTYAKDSGDLTVHRDAEKNVITIYYTKDAVKPNNQKSSDNSNTSTTNTGLNTNTGIYAISAFAGFAVIVALFAKKFKKQN